MIKIIAVIICTTILQICFIPCCTQAADVKEELLVQAEKTKEKSDLKKYYTNRRMSNLREEEKTNEIFVNFMDTTFGESMAETLLKQMLPDFNFKIEKQMTATGSFLVSFDTIEAAINAIMILNEFDSIYYASMNINNVYATYGDKISSGRPSRVAGTIRIKVGSNHMTDVYGSQVPLDSEDENIVPFIDAESGRTMVPLRALAIDEYTTTWNEDTQEVTLERVSEQIKLKIGSRDVIVTNTADETEPKIEKTVVSETELVIYRDRTYVPLRLICELWGCDVEWIEETQEIVIEKG